MVAKLRIGIVGAGTSGIYLASLLLRQGFEVDVFERSPQLRTEGCGILLISSGLQALQQGNPQLSEKILNLGTKVQTFEFRNLRDQLVSSETVTYQEDELPGILVHRGAILKTLLEDVPESCVHLQRSFASASSSSEGIVVHFQDNSSWQGDLLVGADGIFSSVREFVVSGIKPVYLGDIVWRGVVPDNTFCTNGLFIVYVRGRGIYANFFDLGNGFTHWGFFLEAPQKSSEVGLSKPEQIGIPLTELEKLPLAPRSVIASTPKEQIICNFSYDIDPLPQLYSDRILLIGDAAHAKSPTRARGMTAGFEDALSLSRHLEIHATLQEALADFQAERLPIVHNYQTSSREISRKIGRSHRKVENQ